MDSPNPLAHLRHPEYVAAEESWATHVGLCEQCRQAAGPPPPDCLAADRALYACDEGVRLHEVAVLTAHRLYRKASGVS